MNEKRVQRMLHELRSFRATGAVIFLIGLILIGIIACYG